jgi:hypothetical protein
MSRFVYLLRAAILVLGISALGTLFTRLLFAAGLREFLIMHQKSIPGAVTIVSALEHLAYGLTVLVLALLVARGYRRQLFPAHMRWLMLALMFGVGVVFAVFFNHPIHVLLFEVFFGKSQIHGGTIGETIAGAAFSTMKSSVGLLGWPAFSTIVLTPLVEELTDRGILFKEAEDAPLWQIAIVSFLVFSLSHFAIGGTAKVLAVAPVAVLFVAVRLWSGSFVYAAAAHAGVNAAALFKLQVF